MNDLTSISALTRILVDDAEKSTTDVFFYTTSSLFTLTDPNANSITSVTVNGIESGVTYTAVLPRLRITSTLHVDDVISIDYKSYKNWSDDELARYVRSAIVQLSINNFQTYKIDGTDIYPEPTESEANLIALIASILINPQNISYRMPDISVSVPKDLNTFDKVRKVIAIYKKDGPGQFYIAESYPYYYERP